MYNLNPLLRGVLITADEVLFHAPTKQTFDRRWIEQSIIIAEERFIRPLLGSPLYKYIVTLKNVTVTDANKAGLQTLIGADYTLQNDDIVNAFEILPAAYKALWKEVLWKLTAEAVLLLAVPDAFVQFGAEGIIHTTPPASAMSSAGSVTPDMRAVKWVMDKKLMDRIEPMVEAVKTYICENKTEFPLYDSAKLCPGCYDDGNVGMSRKTAWITSIYDEENTDCCP